MKILNLYSGLGGNRKLWTDCSVTAIESDNKIASLYSKFYPNDTVIVGDAKEYLLKYYFDFDFIWFSPACQANSKMIRSGRNRTARFPDLSIYEISLFLTYNFTGFWLGENVLPYYSPLMPAKKIGRHLFWSNFEISDFTAPKFQGFIGKQNLENKKELQNWLGIFYEENIYYGKNHCPTQVLRNCVHPDLGLHIFNCIKNQNHAKSKRKINPL